jgi:hypothetical protein
MSKTKSTGSAFDARKLERVWKVFINCDGKFGKSRNTLFVNASSEPQAIDIGKKHAVYPKGYNDTNIVSQDAERIIDDKESFEEFTSAISQNYMPAMNLYLGKINNFSNTFNIEYS